MLEQKAEKVESRVAEWLIGTYLDDYKISIAVHSGSDSFKIIYLFLHTLLTHLLVSI